MECTDVESEEFFEAITFMIQIVKPKKILIPRIFHLKISYFKIKKQLSHSHKLLGDKLFNVLRIALF